MKTAASHCYDCGKQHPKWVEDLLLRLWESTSIDEEWTPDEQRRMAEFSADEHPNCFK